MKIKTQPNDYSCGIYSIINSLIALGDEKSPEEVQELTKTDFNGTDTQGILDALDGFGYKYRKYQSRDKNLAWRWVLNNSVNYPLILYLDRDHWAVIAGRIRNRVVLIDSLNTAHLDSKEELLDRWGNNGWYWGLRIG